MRGDSGKNIYSQVLPHTLAQMDTAKAHTHIAMRCELTAVFPCFISCGNFVSSTESCRSIYYDSKVQRYCNLGKTQNIFCFFLKNAVLSMAYVQDKWYLLRIQSYYGLKPLYVLCRFISILCINVEVSHGYFLAL